MESEHMLDKKDENKSKFPATSKVILNKFNVLAEGNDKQRLQETRQLLYSLQKLQAAYRQTHEDGLCSDVEYSLLRLIKGLASNRKWARIGFATALTQLISSFETIEIKTILKRIDKTLTYTKQEAKSERGQIQFGKVTALACVIRSNCLKPDSGEEIKAIIGNLNELKTQKTYLLLPCVYGLEQLLLKVDKSTFNEHVLPELKEELTCGWEKADANTLLLILTCQKKGLIDSSFLKTHWRAKSLLDRKNWEKMTEIIIASKDGPILLHRVNEVILEEINRIGVPIVDMWKEVLVKLFEPGRRKVIYLGLFYLRAVVKTITSKEQILEVFNLATCQMFHKNLIVREMKWKELAVSVANELLKLCSSIEEKHLQVTVLRHFLYHNFTCKDNYFFKKLLTQLKPEDAMEFSVDLKKIIRGDKVSEFMDFKSHNMRCWAISALKSIISNSEATDEVLSLLEFCLLHSLFNIENKAKGIRHVTPLSAPFTDQIRNFLRDSLLATFISLQRPGKKDLTTVFSVSYKLARYAESLLTEKSVSLINELPEEAVEELSRSLDIVAKLQKKSSQTPDSQAFQILFLHLSFQLFMEPNDGLDIVKDVHVCFEKSQKKTKKASQNGEEEPEWMDVMTELLISLMSKTSRATRSVANNVFRLLSPHVSESTLDLIVNVLVPEEDDDGDGGPITFRDKDEESEDENTSEKPELALNGVHGNEDSDEGNKDGGTDESDEESSAEEEENGDVNEQLRQTVKAALGSAAAASSDEEEESDDGMGDEEMFRLDDALSEAFRAMQKGKSKEEKTRKVQLVTFRLRTLDLLETFALTHPSTGLIVCLLSPLLDMMESGLRHKEEMQLGKRANSILNQIISYKKLEADPDLDEEDILEKMEELIEYSTKVSSLHMVNEVSKTFVFLMKVMLLQDVPTSNTKTPRKTRSSSTSKNGVTETQPSKATFPDKALSVLKKSLSDCLNRKDSRLHHVFFRSIFQKYSKLIWPLSGILLDCLKTETVRVFLRTQAASLLSHLLMADMTNNIDPEEWLKFVNIFTGSVSKILQELNEDSLKPKYTHEVIILVKKFVTNDKENGKILVEKLKDKFQSLQSKLPKHTKQLCNKIFSQFQKPGEGDKQKKKKRNHSKPKGTEEAESPIKSPKLSNEVEEPSAKKNKKREKRKSRNLSTSVNGAGILSDSSAPSGQSETKGEATPKKKKKSKTEDDVELKNESQENNDCSIKRKVAQKKTPRKEHI